MHERLIRFFRSAIYTSTRTRSRASSAGTHKNDVANPSTHQASKRITYVCESACESACVHFFFLLSVSYTHSTSFNFDYLLSVERSLNSFLIEKKKKKKRRSEKKERNKKNWRRNWKEKD